MSLRAKRHDRTVRPVVCRLWIKPQTCDFHDFLLILLQMDRLQLTAVCCNRREKAVSKIMQRMQADNDRREENLFSRLQVSLKSAAEEAVGRLSAELYHNLKSWEAKMDNKMQTHLNNHRLDFEEKWGNTLAQLELGSKDGVISMAEFRIRSEVQKTVDKNWKDRMENEDKVTTGKIESLHSIVNRLEQEVTTLKGVSTASVQRARWRPLRAAVVATSVLGFLVVRVCGCLRVSS